MKSIRARSCLWLWELVLLTADLDAAEGRIGGRLVALGERGGPGSAAHPVSTTLGRFGRRG